MASAILPFDNPTASPVRSFDYFGGRMTIHADSHDTHGGFALVEFAGVPGFEPPLHVHTREDELFYVIEGELNVRRGYETLDLGPGQSAFLPRNIPHTFKVKSSFVRGLVYITPGGFEDYFRTVMQPDASGAAIKAPPSPERLAAIAARYGITFLS